MSRRLIWVAGFLVAGFVLSVVVGLWLRLWTSELDVSAPHKTLRMGETVQLAVARKTWLGTESSL